MNFSTCRGLFGLALTAVAFLLVSCSRSKVDDKTETAKFIALLNQRIPKNWNSISPEKKTKERMDCLNQELDQLYRYLIRQNNTGAFEKATEIDSYVAACTGVFGILEIANRNYMLKSSTVNARKESLEKLLQLTTHRSPHVRGAALYALGKLRHYEYLDAVVARFDDDARSAIFFPPFVESNNGLTSSVSTCAKRAVISMLGDQKGEELLYSFSPKPEGENSPPPE